MTRRIWEVEYAGSPKTLWSEVTPTDAQLAVAAKLGIQVFPEDTYAAVAATILEAVGDVIGCPPREVSGRQYDLAEELGIDVSDCTSVVGCLRQNSGGDSDRQCRRGPSDGPHARAIESSKRWNGESISLVRLLVRYGSR